MKEIQYVSSSKLNEYILQVLLKLNVSDQVAQHVSKALLYASLRGIDSHGVRLLPHYVRAIQGGRINPNPKYSFDQTGASTGILDADHTFGHAACMHAVKKAVELAHEVGSGHVAIRNSTHFGAASYYAHEIAKCDMIGVSMTNTDSQLRTPGGIRPFLGNNPICFSAPAEDGFVFTLDMATSVMTYNKIKQMAAAGQVLPSGVAADSYGKETTDPSKAAMLIPFGDYRGYGLSILIELFCSMFTGMLYGPDIPKMFEAPLHQKRNIGQFISAYRINCFQPIDIFKKRFSELLYRLRNEPRMQEEIPIFVPGDKEEVCYRERIQHGIPLPAKEYEDFCKLTQQFGLINMEIKY